MNILKIRITKIVDFLGRKALNSLRYIAKLSSFTVETLIEWKNKPSRINQRPIVSQIIFSGIDALPAITILSLAIALSITAQSILLLQTFTTEKDVIQILTQLVALEIGPLLTAIILIGRSGSAIAVDLGNMRLHKEILGLELLGINIKQFFVLPRILGVALSQFALAVYFSGIAMIVGIIFSALMDSVSNYKYLFILSDALTPFDLIIFSLKNLIFGLIIGITACFHGLSVERSATEVPQQTQRAIVNSLILIFTFDGLIAVLT